jgi:hypothetical protein
VIDAVASERHFADHLRPIFDALPAKLRGTFYTGERIQLPHDDRLALVASYRDLCLARSRRRWCVLSEHGAGQSYLGARSGSYIGASDRRGVLGVLVPGPLQAEAHTASQAAIPAYQTGVPKLDHLHSARAVAQLAGDDRFDLVGHAHPRMLRRIIGDYRRAGIEVVPDFADVIDRADVYVCDNSSTMYEWASLDRPVVVLDGPTYRRHVHHGLRFWSHADLGPRIDQGADLADAILAAVAGEGAERRRQIVAEVYVATDGKAAKRGVRALREVHREWDHAGRPSCPTPTHSVSRRRGRVVADERIYGYDSAGRRVLVAAAGQPIPRGFTPDRPVEARDSGP